MSREIGKSYNELAVKYYSSRSIKEKKEIKNKLIKLADTTLKRSLTYIVDQNTLYILKNKMSIYEDDLRQECLIILLNTLDSYEEDRGKSFYNYFYFNVKRRANQLLRQSNAKKRSMHVRLDELYGQSDDDEASFTLDIVFTPEGPEYKDEVNVSIQSPRENVNTNIMKEFVLKNSVGFEKEVMNDVLYSNTECISLSSLARRHHVSVPTISNTINKVKGKVRSRASSYDLF
jgi:DNA-directed RNA polymerase specialized sigma24 family protein